MSEESVEASDQFYILSTSARSDDRTRVMKHGDTFAVFDRFGDIESAGTGELGIYDHDTRILSRLQLRLDGRRPLLLSSTIKDDNAVLAVDLMNPDLEREHGLIPRGTVHIDRARVLLDGACHERIRVHNYGRVSVEVALSIECGADFADIFEVRGMHRARRGKQLPAQVDGASLELGYEGLDGRIRRTRLAFDPAPTRLSETRAEYALQLPPRGEVVCQLVVTSDGADGAGERPSAAAAWPAVSYEDAARKASDTLARARSDEPRISTSSEAFNVWLSRSLADLHMMRTETAHGPYPYAGVPWFSTAFGRDGIITALECLWFNPNVAKGVLQYLAATQAETDRAESDAQPGKVLHETRSGEMAATGEVPFARYYGSVDATPLFVMLAGAYYERTGDLRLMQVLWPHVERALEWIDRYGDIDTDGFVEYARRSETGLVQQGWKDSNDSVFHRDGTLAEAPIALCEVQAYVYAAKRYASALADALGKHARARELDHSAKALRRRFEEVFWCDELATYALALDGRKQLCRVRASNAGHCLYAGIASDERAARVAATLLADPSYSGWGIRTVAQSEAQYNPMSYHNGSVWPHDNALIAAGLARYGRKSEVLRVLTGLFDASSFFDLHRLPELFCGFGRRPDESPTLYPVSCAPQSWASAAVLMLLQACLGLEVSGAERKVLFANPVLPEFLREVHIEGLRVGDASVDLYLVRHREDVGINVVRREGRVNVVTVK
jgi:glycogen debranching enzyme